jgi:hypothetical protein
MAKAWIVGLLSGLGLVYIVRAIKPSHGRLAERLTGRRGTEMTVNDGLVKAAQEALAAKPEASVPGHDFLRDWAYGNAGLEDERITIDQVENVLREKSA